MSEGTNKSILWGSHALQQASEDVHNTTYGDNRANKGYRALQSILYYLLTSVLVFQAVQPLISFCGCNSMVMITVLESWLRAGTTLREGGDCLEDTVNGMEAAPSCRLALSWTALLYILWRTLVVHLGLTIGESGKSEVKSCNH